jgi:hypothetical protein
MSLERVTISHVLEQPAMPTYIRSRYKTVQKGLAGICQGKKPDRIISEYYIDLIFSRPANEYFACLYGVNTNFSEQHQHHTSIVFEPSAMHFKFPKEKYKNFTYEQMKKVFVAEVEEFILTEKFRKSFLSQSNIKMGFSAGPIWTGATDDNKY